MPATSAGLARRPYRVYYRARVSWLPRGQTMLSDHATAELAIARASRSRDRWHEFWAETHPWWCWSVVDLRDGSTIYETY